MGKFLKVSDIIKGEPLSHMMEGLYSAAEREVLGPFFITQDDVDAVPTLTDKDLDRPALLINGRYAMYPTFDAAKKAKASLKPH